MNTIFCPLTTQPLWYLKSYFNWFIFWYKYKPFAFQ